MTYERMIADNMELIHKLAHKYKPNVRFISHDDVVQEGLMKLWQVYQEYDGESAVTTFITTVLTNHFLDLIRYESRDKRRNKDEKGNVLSDVKDVDLDIIQDETDFYNGQYSWIVSRAYQKLENHSKKDILLELISGTSQTNMANQLGVSRQYVSKLWVDFLKDLREEIE